MTCCAAVGGRLDEAQLAELESALARVGELGAESLGALATRFGVSKSALSRHRTTCLGHAPAASLATVPSRSRPVPSEKVAREAGTGHIAPIVPGTFQGVDSQAESRIDTIADMVRLALWKNRGTVLGLAARWGLTEREVNQLHKQACRRLAAARGGPIAQREHSVAVCSKIRDDELQYAEKLDAEIAECLRPREPQLEPDLRGARTRATLAATARATALQAQKQIDAWTQKDAITVTVSQAAPDAEVWGLVRVMLDAWAPGLSERVEEGLGAFEDGGRKRFDDFVSEVQADMRAIVVRGE